MSAKTLFLAWQDNEPGQAWFLVGRLDAGRRQAGHEVLVGLQHPSGTGSKQPLQAQGYLHL